MQTFSLSDSLKRAAGLMKVDNVERVIALGTQREREPRRGSKNWFYIVREGLTGRHTERESIFRQVFSDSVFWRREEFVLSA